MLFKNKLATVAAVVLGLASSTLAAQAQTVADPYPTGAPNNRLVGLPTDPYPFGYQSAATPTVAYRAVYGPAVAYRTIGGRSYARARHNGRHYARVRTNGGHYARMAVNGRYYVRVR
ncbi:MAG: hypothetical protein ACLPKB_00540 [Xanthobacteraceae bacterium]